MVGSTTVAVASPAPTVAPSGACSQVSASSLSDRPGIGRAPATNGAACVVPRGALLFETGYRTQTTHGAQTQTLVAYPNLVVRAGLGAGNELIALPGTAYTRRTGNGTPLGLAAETGAQDAGIGVKHTIFNGAAFQDAANLFITFPTGAAGESGFSAGLTTYAFGYSATWQLSTRFGFATTQNLIENAAPGASGAQRFVQYQPSIAVSYAFSPAVTLLGEDQGAFPSAPGAGSGNRTLLGVQAALSRFVVLDTDAEVNLLPPNGVAQHAFDVGLTLLMQSR